ncbi:unnamed protein product, partial [Hapterophycus canaliculatus]
SQADAYVLDFPDPTSKRSVKNVQLVLAADGPHNNTFLSFGKSDTDEFSLDFRYPLSPMQAFGLALAALDSNV